jgi:tRNA pseudouridine38-40 synthase
MPRFHITVEYEGTAFVGWQKQTNGMSIQQRLEQSIKAFSGLEVLVQGAGRTDAGVHALGQSAHFDLAKDVAPDTIVDAVNFYLRPDPIAVLGCEQVDEGFNARFSATARHYLYRIINRRPPLVMDRGRAWRISRHLDVPEMQAAAVHLVGNHDFTTFRSIHCQADSPVKTLDRLDVRRAGEDVEITASARSFLHNQVRCIVGTLEWVGEGKWSPADVATALARHDRAAGGPTAPAAGLYLVRVDY